MNRKLFLRSLLLSLILITALVYSASATHLRAGEITVERIGCSNIWRITVTVYTNTINTNVLFGGEDDWLDFGDGQRMLIPEQDNIPRPDLGEGVATASFTVSHAYSGNGRYLVSYSEPNRNQGVVNMDGSVNTRFYIETELIIDNFLGCNNTPRLLVPPIDRACTGIAWFHNPGAFDPDGDSLSYELVIPFRERNTTVVGYKDPADPFFFSNYQTGNEDQSGPPTFSINPIDGTLTWDSPGRSGEYNIAFVIREWRFVEGAWRRIGFVRRDMQIIVDDCDNERPDLQVPEDVCVEAGSTLNATIFGTDPDGDSVKIEAFSEILELAPAQFPATVSPFPARFARPTAELEFEWLTDCSHIKDQPYQVVFKITDKSPTGSRLVTFKTWNIRVVGPAPQWVSATTDLATRIANLQWDPYVCENAETIQVWRRVDSFEFEPDSCQVGMPDGLGYELIETVDAGTASYLDDNSGMGLASGAQYCYRLVATFARPKGGESYVSQEICLDPILADKAIITNVTVDHTNGDLAVDGRVTVRWMPPFEADPVQFPPPYTYNVGRAEGFAGNSNLTIVATNISDTVFTDTGLRTRDLVYNYRIIAIDNNGVALDSSATASTVRLEADSEVNSIRLSWSAFVPWSNQISTPPSRHLIYRGLEGATDDELLLIDSVDVVAGGFTYLDMGPLDPSQIYCYKVMTRGAYGNPRIAEPLLNFSQLICTQPGDTLAPCKPLTPVPDQPVDCAAYVTDTESCDRPSFTNTIRWTRTQDDCDNDISYYRIWVASRTTGDFVPLPIEWRDTVYVDENLSSFARCYKIQAVDRSGNESELSDPICFDNCPYYELPNFFSPNGDNCNDYFSAFSSINRNYGDSEGAQVGDPCSSLPSDVTMRCARFVEKVEVRIYNRWGKEVFHYTSGGERTIYVDWDGRDHNGRELATGVYYYVADVKFDTVDPAKQQQIVKGWVQLMR